MNEHKRPTHWVWVAITAALLLVVVACGSDEPSAGSNGQSTEDAAVAGANEDESPSGQTSDSDSTSTDTGLREDEDARVEVVDDTEPPDLTGLRVVTTWALGGLRLGVDSSLDLVQEGEMIRVRHSDGSGYVVVARVSHATPGPRVETIEDFLDVVKQHGAVAAEPSGHSRRVLGYELDGYQFRAEPGRGNDRLFPSAFMGSASNYVWGPAPSADLFLAEVGGGVLAVGVVGENEESLPALHDLLDEILPTLSLTDELLEVPLSPPVPFQPLGDSSPVEPRDADNGLIQPFVSLDPGTHDLIYLAEKTEVTTPEGWMVLPNFPGFVVFGDVGAGLVEGPGDHDIVFSQGVTGLHSLGPTRGDLDDPTPLLTREDWESFLTSGRPGVELSGLDPDAELGGLPALRFDLTVNEESTCKPAAPCEFAFSGPDNDFVTFIRAGYVGRFWWIPTFADGAGLLVSAQVPAASADWLDGRAAALLESVDFDA